MGKELMEAIGKDAQVLHRFALFILGDPRVKTRDVSLALQAAQKAYELSSPKVAAVADTYAHALFENGQGKEAIERMNEAIAICDNPELKGKMEAALKTFRESKSSGLSSQ